MAKFFKCLDIRLDVIESNKFERRLRVHPNSNAKMKERIKVITSRSNDLG
jgi:hypothetical protein